MIKLLNISKTFNRGRANQIHAIDQTTLQLGNTGLVTFLGNSGCGKTTLLNAIGGLDKIDKGEIWIDDQKLSGISASKKDNIRNHKIGYIFQNYNLLENETVFYNVAIVLKMLGLKDPAEIEKRVDFVLDTIGIKQYKKRPVKMLSGGERQRVGIARAIVKNPDVIIADEPTGNLDSGNTLEIMNIIKAISRDKLVILVTHERPLAQFFSDRIIEIVDGKVVSDQENKNNGKLDYRIDNKLYLKDMAVQDKIETPLGTFNLYGDDVRKHNIKVVIKDNNIYIDADGLLKGSDKVELIDDHYNQLDKESYENYVFDYKNVLDTSKLSKKGYSSIYSLWSMFKDGFSRVIHYSKLKKFLLLGFVFAAMFVTLAISYIAGTLKVEDKDFMQFTKNYVQVETGKLTPDTYNHYAQLPDQYYALPGDSKVSLPVQNNQFYQLSSKSLGLTGSLAGTSQLKDDNLIEGTRPKTPNEVVIDVSIIKKAKQMAESASFNLIDPKDYIGKTIADNFKIVGVSNSGSPSFYVDDSMLMPLVLKYASDQKEGSTNLQQYDFQSSNDTPVLTKGRWPTGDYEVVINKDDDTEIGKTIKVKGLGKALKVVGKYHNPSNSNALLVNQNTLLYSKLGDFSKVTIAPHDKAKFIESLAGSNTKVYDTYKLSRDQFINDSRESNNKAIITSLIIVLISLIEVYLMLRASFLSRIKEVGVLRAIGLKKLDIYKMFFGEVFAITFFTAIPGISLISYFLYYLSSLDLISRIVVVSPATVAVSFMLLLAFNTIAGLLPAFKTLRQTPARILARTDIN